MNVAIRRNGELTDAKVVNHLFHAETATGRGQEDGVRAAQVVELSPLRKPCKCRRLS